MAKRKTTKRVFQKDQRVKIMGIGMVAMVATAVIPMMRCPFCRVFCRYRHGREFDHMRRCNKCDVSWVPGDVVLIIDGIQTEDE